MTTTALNEFLKKWEKYLGSYSPMITQENWPLFKEKGYLPKLPEQQELQKKLLIGGWDKQLIWDDFINGVLTKESIEELILKGVLTEEDMKKLAESMESELSEYAFGDGVSPYKEKDICTILDFLEEKGY